MIRLKKIEPAQIAEAMPTARAWEGAGFSGFVAKVAAVLRVKYCG
jgi:hypothetical protein